MIIVAAKMTVKPGKRSEFVRSALDCIKNTRQEEGNISYTLYLSTEDEVSAMFFEEWENQAALDAHMQTPHFKTLMESNKTLVESSEVKVYEGQAK